MLFFTFLSVQKAFSSVKLSICLYFNHQTEHCEAFIFKRFLRETRNSESANLKTEFLKYLLPPPCFALLCLGFFFFFIFLRCCCKICIPTEDQDVIGIEKMPLTLWITVRSTKLWQHWLTWQWVQQYIYHLWLCCRKSNKRQTIPFRAVTGSLWLTVHALEISDFKLYPCC